MFTAISRYNHKETKNYRFLTLEECKNLKSYSAYPVLVLGKDGRVAHVKVTSVKTWKTRPDVQVGWKFGLYESGKELIKSDADNTFFVTEIKEA